MSNYVPVAQWYLCSIYLNFLHTSDSVRMLQIYVWVQLFLITF